MIEKPEDRERREKLFEEAKDYHLRHALSLIDRTSYDILVGRVDKRIKDGVTTYTFMGDPILEVRCEEGWKEPNPADNYSIRTYDKTLHFKHLKGDPPLLGVGIVLFPLVVVDQLVERGVVRRVCIHARTSRYCTLQTQALWVEGAVSLTWRSRIDRQ